MHYVRLQNIFLKYIPCIRLGKELFKMLNAGILDTLYLFC